MVNECCNSVTAVCEMEHSPLWSMTLPDDLCLDDYRKKSIDVPRQKWRNITELMVLYIFAKLIIPIMVFLFVCLMNML